MMEFKDVKRLEQLELEYRLLTESALECIWKYNIENRRFTYVSPSVVRLRGFTVDEMMDQSLSDILPVNYWKKAKAATVLLINLYNSGEREEDILTYEGDFEIYCKDNVIKQMEVTLKLTRNLETDSFEIIGVSRDISERKNLEHQLNQAIESKNEIIERLRDSERVLKHLTDELNHKNHILSDLAVRDNMTGIFNRYSFNQKIAEESERCRRYHYPLSTILFDIDDFKKINDMLGHQAGDHVLIEISSLVNRLIRKHDFFARWGGEEFIILLPQTSLAGAAKAAEKFRNRIEKIQHLDTNTAVTASFGVTEFMHGETVESWFRRVDYALLRSKSEGKNRITAVKWSEAVSFARISLEWKKEWESGNYVIDDQHRKLIHLGNVLLDAILLDCSNEEARKAMMALIDHVRFHHKREEEILKELGYPELKEHADIHDGLLTRLEQLEYQCYEGKLKSSAVFTFLFDEVVVGHFLKDDVLFFPLIREISIEDL